MKSCIYYDVDKCSSEEVARARSLVNGNTSEIVSAICVWPNAADAVKPTAIADFRAPAFLNTIYPWIAESCDRVAEVCAEAAILGGMSLSRIAVYDVLYRMAPLLHQFHGIAAIRSQKVDRVIWAHRQTKPPSVDAIGDACGAKEFEFLDLEAGPARPLESTMALVKSSLGSLFRTCSESFKPLARSEKASRAALGGAVVFADYFPNSVKAALPIARELAMRGHRVAWLAGRRRVADALTKLEVESFDLDRLSGAAVRKQIRRQRQAIRGSIRHTALNVPLPEALRDLPDTCRQYLVRTLLREIESAWNSAAGFAARFSALDLREPPKALCTTSFSSLFARTAAEWMRTLGSSSIYVQHGIMFSGPTCADFLNDHVLVWGNYDQRNLLVHAPPAVKSVVVTGSSIVRRGAIRASRASGASGANSPTEAFKLLYLPTMPGGAYLTHDAAVAAAVVIAEVAKDAYANLLIKLHPGDRTGVIEAAMAAYANVRVSREADLHAEIEAADVVIVTASTTGLHACMAGRPLVVLQESEIGASDNYADYGAALPVALTRATARQELAEAIKMIRTDADTQNRLELGRRALIDDMLGGLDADPIRTSADTIEAILGAQ